MNLKNFKAHQNKVYCAVHYPADHQKVKATQVTDSISVKHATNAPKKTTEGLSTVHKGDGRFRKEGKDFQVEYQQDNAFEGGSESEGTTTYSEGGSEGGIEGGSEAEGEYTEGEGEYAEGEYAEGEYAEGEYAEGEGEGEVTKFSSQF